MPVDSCEFNSHKYQIEVIFCFIGIRLYDDAIYKNKQSYNSKGENVELECSVYIDLMNSKTFGGNENEKNTNFSSNINDDDCTWVPKGER